MTQASMGWEKDENQTEQLQRLTKRNGRLKFMVAGLLVLGAALYLIVTGTLSGASYFITVEELLNDSSYTGQTVRISGAVIGESIVYDTSDPASPNIEFTISHIPTEFDNLALALHESVNNPDLARLARARRKRSHAGLAPKRGAGHSHRLPGRRRHVPRQRTAAEVP